MKSHSIFHLLVLSGCSLLFSCSTNLLVLEDMLPKAKQTSFDVSFSQSSLVDFAVNFDLVYEISNPYKKDLPLPDHAMGIYLNGKDIGLTKIQKGVSVPSKSSTLLNYSFSLTSDQLQKLLGKNNKITFKADLELDLTNYTDMLPNFQLAVSEDFDLESAEFTPFLNNLLQRKIGKFNFSYEHSTLVKIPAPPVITKSNEPISIQLLGGGNNWFNPGAIKNALTPFGDLLITGETDGLKNSFVDAITTLSVPVPAPTFSDWDRTINRKIEEYMLNLIKPFDDDIGIKWEEIKTLVYRNNSFKLTEYFIDNFLDPTGTLNASEKWDTFQDAYSLFKSTEFPNEIPGPQTRGFEIQIPFTFRNQNEFPISIPIFRSSVMMPGGHPFTMYVKPKNMGEISLGQVPSNQAKIPAEEEKTLYVVFSFDMKAFNQGIYSLFMKNEFEPNLGGVMSYDFGYGPLYVGYDLNKMSLDYK